MKKHIDFEWNSGRMGGYCRPTIPIFHHSNPPIFQSSTIPISLKNHYNKLFLLALLAVLTACEPGRPDEEEWLSLFNGKDLTGWDVKISGYALNDNYRSTFRVVDGVLEVNYDEYDRFNGEYGHLYYREPFSYYRLRVEYRFTGEQLPGGESWNVRNSGVMVHSQSAQSVEFDQDFPVSIEMQFLGGLGEGERTTANVCTPGTFVVTDGQPNYAHCINSTSKTYDGDQWVTVDMIVLGDSLIQHVIDNEIVLSYTKPQIGGGFISKDNSPDEWQNFGITKGAEWIARENTLLSGGFIALQAESHPIGFRKVELLNMEGCMDPRARNYKSYYVKADNAKCEY